MSRTIQLRDVPDEVFDAWVADAERLGISLNDYLVRKLERIASDRPAKPTKEEILARLRQLKPVEVSEEPADIIRRAREGER